MTRRTLLFFRWGVFAAACALLYLRLSGHQGNVPRWEGVITALSPFPYGIVVVVLGMMVLNWSLEARKWQLLVRPLQPLGFVRAFAGTIAGTAIGLITPNRVGEFAGRVLFLEPEHRVQGSFATVLGSLAQFVVTLLMGGVAVLVGRYVRQSHHLLTHAWDVLVWSTLLMAGAAVLLFFSPGVFGRILLVIPWLRRFERQALALERSDGSMLWKVFGWSAARYAVFTLQFALLLHALAGVPLADAMTAVPVIFLVTTLVPTTALTELGVRSSVAATFVNGDASAVVLATALVWMINIVVPALAGSVVLLVARIRTTPEGT